MFNWSVTKTHAASGSVATVWAMWVAKSASVRVGLGAGRPDGGGHQSPLHHVEVGDQALRAVAHVLELTPLDLAWPQGEGGRGALQGWDARHLVGTDHMATPGGDRRRLGVQRADRLDLRSEDGRVGLTRREPVPAVVRLECGRLQKPETARRCGRRYVGLCVA